jgi:hypothetical protein
LRRKKDNNFRKKDSNFRRMPKYCSNQKNLSASGNISISKRNDGFNFDLGIDIDFSLNDFLTIL